jgi:hypothetical protein
MKNSFNVTSTTLRVTDPCYDRDTNISCFGILKNVLPGEWVAVEEYIDGLVFQLTVFHSNYFNKMHDTMYEADFKVSVDSGQAGFFDETKFPSNSNNFDYHNLESFYRKICDSTLCIPNSEGVDFGVAASSGYGDGTYKCKYGVNADNQIVVATIIFISDNDDNDYDEYYDDIDSSEDE